MAKMRARRISGSRWVTRSGSRPSGIARASRSAMPSRRSAWASNMTPPSELIRPPSKAAVIFLRRTAGKQNGRRLSSVMAGVRASIPAKGWLQQPNPTPDQQLTLLPPPLIRPRHEYDRLAAGRTLDDLVRDDRIMKLCCDSQCALLSYDVPGDAILGDLRRVQSEGRAPNPDAFAAKPDLAKAEAMLDRFGFVGFVGDLQNDVMRLSMKFGFHPPREIPKRNHDPQGETSLDGIHPETLAAVRRWNAADIALYETARRRFSGRPRVPRSEVERELLARGTYAPIGQPMEFAMSGPFPGSNWYACEDAARGGHRWTGPLNETTLELPLDRGFDFEVSLVVLIPDLGDLTARLGDTELPIRGDASDRRVHRITVPIPAALVSENALTSVRFQTKHVFQPSETDIRILSFMVRELSISRVEPVSLTTTLSVGSTDRSGEWNMALNEPSTEQSKPARLAAAQSASDAKEWRRAAELWDACRTDFPQD